MQNNKHNRVIAVIAVTKQCNGCKIPKEEKDFRKGSRVCRSCISEKDKAKRLERWSYLGLDMSTKY